MALTPADVDAAVPTGGTPSRALTNAALKQLITDIANVGVGIGVGTVNAYIRCCISTSSNSCQLGLHIGMRPLLVLDQFFQLEFLVAHLNNKQ